MKMQIFTRISERRIGTDDDVQAKEGVETCCVCMFTPGARSGRQLLRVYTSLPRLTPTKRLSREIWCRTAGARQSWCFRSSRLVPVLPPCFQLEDGKLNIPVLLSLNTVKVMFRLFLV